MWSMVRKEFHQLRRDRRTLALLFGLPLILLVVLGYAASFDVDRVPGATFGPDAEAAARRLPPVVDVDEVSVGGDRADAEEALRRGEVALAVVTGPQPVILVDGSELFQARAARDRLTGVPEAPPVEILFNPDLTTSTVMVPGLIGVVLVFVGTVATSLGVVRERQEGTLEQLAVMPLRPLDVFVGKLGPYLLVAVFDLAVVLTVGLTLFDVPFRGSAAVFALGAALFLFVTLGLGIVISTVSENQGQAVQLAVLVMVPQILLSGLIFPLDAMPTAIAWFARALPLTWFIEIARGVMLRGAPGSSLAAPLVVLVGMGVVVATAAVVRFRAQLEAAA